MHGSGEFAYALAEKGLIDEYEVYVNPLVWGKGNVHVLGDRGTVRIELDDVKRFDSGVVLLTYPRASSSTSVFGRCSTNSAALRARPPVLAAAESA
jgi:RibD C-terminal domain